MNIKIGYSFICAFTFFLLGCTNSVKIESKKIRVAVIKYMHETCTFCPGGDTQIEDWTKRKPFIKGEDVLKSGSFIKGFVDTAEQYNDVELVGINSPDQVFGGSSRSWNSKKSFEHFMNLILDDLKSKMPVHGVYLALHGALAVRDIPRPEAEVVKRIRELVGKDVPIAASFDLHGNEDKEFLKYADAAFVTKRYPHYDAFIQGGRSANFIYRSLKNEYSATSATRKPPILTATVKQWTGQSPSMDIMERARRWESREKDTYVNVFYGFPWSDVPDIGMTIHVITNDNQELADKIADDMAGYIWRVREDFASGTFAMPNEAVQKVKTAIEKEEIPVVLADYSDRPGDATWILKELMNQNIEGVLYTALSSKNTLEQLQKINAKAGDNFDMKVGGYTGEQAGKPLRIKGKLLYFNAHWGYDKIAVVEFGKHNLLIITPTYEQIKTPEKLRFGPVNPNNYDVFVTKSRVHFRRGFDETGYAKTIIVVDAPGSWFGTTRLDALDYKFGPIDKMYPFNRTVK